MTDGGSFQVWSVTSIQSASNLRSYDQQGAAVLIADSIENKHVRQHGGYVHFFKLLSVSGRQTE